MAGAERAACIGTAMAVVLVFIRSLVTPLGVTQPTDQTTDLCEIVASIGITPVKSCNRPGDGTKTSYRTHLGGPVTLVAGAGLRVIELSS